MKVVVGQGHIDKGLRGAACECPVALALNTCGAFRVHVGIDVVKFYDVNNYFCIRRLPETAQIFVQRFDDGLTVEPFEFELEGL